MMNEKLKKYVNAYIDGEEVEVRYDKVWNKVTSFGQFDKALSYRIKPKAEDKWQRVIDEGYLCKFSGSHYGYSDRIDILKSYQNDQRIHPFEAKETPAIYANCEVLREKGIKQPYFQGDDIPRIDGQIVVYFKSGVVDMMYADVLAWDWSEVIAYIEV